MATSEPQENCSNGCAASKSVHYIFSQSFGDQQQLLSLSIEIK